MYKNNQEGPMGTDDFSSIKKTYDPHRIVYVFCKPKYYLDDLLLVVLS